MALAAPGIAVSRSASLKTTFGDLPPSSERNFLEIAGGSVDDQLADFGRSREGDLVDVGMRSQRSSCRLAIAGDDVDHAFGESGFHDQFAQTQRGERSLLRRLQHDGAAGGQRRTKFPRGHQQREVPRNDLADDSDRLAQRVRKILRARRVGNREWNRVAFDLGRPSRHVAEQIDRQRDVSSLRDVERLAVVEALDVAELLGMLFEQVGELPDQAAALGCRHAAPRAVIEGIARSSHGQVNIFAIAFRDLRQNFAGCGIVGRKGLAGSGVHPLPLISIFRGLSMNSATCG